jgi:thiamine biosynthesis protein ThiI
LDKLEIEGIAKRIGTYEISIQSDGGPSCLILPERVITDAVPENVMAEEAKVDISEMVRFAADNVVELRGPDTWSS